MARDGGQTVPVTDPSPVYCSLCGRRADAPPLTWLYERDPRRGGQWICDTCARSNLRAIEAKLSREWW